VSEFREKVSGWKKPYVYLKQYEQHGYPIFRFELMAFVCRDLLGLPRNDLSPEFIEYLSVRRRPNGSFNNTPASDGGDGHVMNTWWGLRVLHLLGRADEKEKETIAWLHDCQLRNGGFTFQPKPEFGDVECAAYTWAAVRALKQLNATPKNRKACLDYLWSLENADGGFGERPGWQSNPLSTYHALDALDALGALTSQSPRKSKIINRKSPPLPNLKVFTIQIEAHGKGSPAEAVDLARGLRIHLWGAKNAKPEWIAEAQRVADRAKVPVKFFVANEEYGTWVNVPGLGTYSHTSDLIAPPGVNAGSSLANKGVVSWPEFREKRLVPLQKGGGELIWQFGENEELSRIYFDDSLQCGGYAALSTFHFGNPDFTNSQPFLQCYRGQIPFVALQDAHGEEPWWFADMTTGFRTVFLASEPTWEGWLNALKNNWVVAIRHDAASDFKTWMHGGSAEVLEFVRQHERDWKWWDSDTIQRPMISIVAVKSEDEFEAGPPGKGVMLRVRCAWENTTQGLPKKPLVELIKLTLDDAEVSPTLVQRKQGAALADHYHQFHWPEPSSGEHHATAVVRILETRKKMERTIRFLV
jgi:hypothetical protein